MVIDHTRDWWRRLPAREPWDPRPSPVTDKELERLKDLLKRAKKYDIANDEEDCELESKIKDLKKVAKEKGIPVKIVFE
jgi:proline dehydrogenase